MHKPGAVKKRPRAACRMIVIADTSPVNYLILIGEEGERRDQNVRIENNSQHSSSSFIHEPLDISQCFDALAAEILRQTFTGLIDHLFSGYVRV